MVSDPPFGDDPFGWGKKDTIAWLDRTRARAVQILVDTEGIYSSRVPLVADVRVVRRTKFVMLRPSEMTA